MSDKKTHLIKVDNREVFLVLAESGGADFTFYLQNDDNDRQVNRLLRKTSGKTDQVKAKSPSPKQNYSCRVYILKTLLDKKDLIMRGSREAGVMFLQKLLEVKEANGNPVQNNYARLKQHLPDTIAGVTPDKLADKNLIRTLLRELDVLLKSSNLDDLFTSASLSRATEEEKKILEQVGDPTARAKLSGYLKFCRLFGDSIKPLAERVRVGRGLAGLSYEGKVWSLSFREQESEVGYAPDSEVDGNLNSIEELCYALYEEILHVPCHVETTDTGTDGGADPPGYQDRIRQHRERKLSEVSGLIVISGATNSAKSLIARGLIHLYLENVNNHQKSERLPHLVTFEDPIEKFFANRVYEPVGAHPQLNVVMSAAGRKVDYTPRQQDTDSGSLQDALLDALRQTPKVFFVGETRRKEDWQSLVDFAATGHLVVTTAHAGSLIEAMHKIFLALEATTPAARNEVASCLLAVVHLKRTKMENHPFGVLVPALWRRVPRGLNSLTAEGLASVLPNSNSDIKDPCSCLGRSYFANQLMELAQGRSPVTDGDFRAKLRKQAIDWDLQGA